MSKRERLPSSKAREIAATLRDDDLPPAQPKKKASKPKPKAPPKPKPAPKPPKVWSQYDEVPSAILAGVGPSVAGGSGERKAYCVCLGDDDSTPMIQCEGCENWFHFRCIDLQADDAARIKVYYCESCSLAGLGETQFLRRPRASSSESVEENNEDGAYNSADDRLPDSAASESEEDQVVVDVAKKRRSTSGPRRPRKRQKAEGTSDEDDDDVYAGDGDPEHDDFKGKKRRDAEKRGKAQLEVMAASRKASSSSSKLRIANDAQTIRTRQGCKTQIGKTLDAIYTTAEPTVVRLDVDSIEQELFDATAEPDASGCLAPKAKYSNKFRTLFSNLRSNAYLRSRLAGKSPDEGLITPHSLVNMTPEDLMTPEQRVLAQQVRDQALKDSIKAEVTAPKAKITHKGEEVVDEFATSDSRMPTQHRRQSSMASPPPTPLGGAQSPLAFVGSPRADSGTPVDEAFSPPASASMPPPVRRPSGLSIRPEDVGGETVSSPYRAEVGDRSASAPIVGPSPTQRTSFDLDSVWGSFNSPTLEQSPTLAEAPKVKADDDMDVDSDSDNEATKKGGAKEEEEYEPDAFPEFEIPTGGQDDADLDAILRSEPERTATSAPASSAPLPASAPPVSAPATSTCPPSGQIPIEHLFPVWDGVCDGPNEPSFAGYAVQVAGRLLGTAKDMWARVLPTGRLRIEGTLALNVGSEYLVQSTFSSSRELVVLALFPDTAGPSILYPEKMPGDMAASGHAQLFSSLLSRKKIAVVLPGERQKKAVKDLYLVPLGRSEPIPDFVELLDAHALGEGAKREKDLILVVAVLQKGMLPPPTFDMPGAPSTSARAPSFSPPPPAHAFSPPPPTQPAAMAQQAPNPLAGVDPGAIQALLQQPHLLQSLVNSGALPNMPQAPVPHMPTAAFAQPAVGPPAGPGSNLLAGLDPSVLGALLKPGQQQQQQQPPLPPQQQSMEPPRTGFAMNPARAAMLAQGDRGGDMMMGGGGGGGGGYDGGRGGYRGGRGGPMRGGGPPRGYGRGGRGY